MADLHVILVNYRNTEDTLECLASLERSADAGVRVIVVDNGSGDGSADAVRRHLAGSALSGTVLESGGNLGFAGGCNAGLRLALREGAAGLLLLLNNDTVVPASFIWEVRRAAEDNPGAIVSGLIRDARTGKPSFSVGVISPLTLVVRHRVAPRGDGYVRLDFASGGLMAIPAAVLGRIGELREDFFMYCEDLEFCLRAREAGVPVVFTSRIEVSHKVGSTSAKTGLPKVYYGFRNQTYITWRQGSALQKLCYLLFLLSQAPALLRRPRIIGQFLAGVRDGLAGVLGARPARSSVP